MLDKELLDKTLNHLLLNQTLANEKPAEKAVLEKANAAEMSKMQLAKEDKEPQFTIDEVQNALRLRKTDLNQELERLKKDIQNNSKELRDLH